MNEFVWTSIAVFATAIVGMLVGAVLATTAAFTRRRRMLAVGARLAINGPGLASIGMGIFLLALPWPLTLLALLPLSFGGLMLWQTLRVTIQARAAAEVLLKRSVRRTR